ASVREKRAASAHWGEGDWVGGEGAGDVDWRLPTSVEARGATYLGSSFVDVDHEDVEHFRDWNDRRRDRDDVTELMGVRSLPSAPDSPSIPEVAVVSGVRDHRREIDDSEARRAGARALVRARSDHFGRDRPASCLLDRVSKRAVGAKIDRMNVGRV